MDPFQIDMELLRRFGAVRTAIQAMGDDPQAGRAALQAAIASVQEQAGEENGELARLLGIFFQGVGEIDEEEISATSRFATGALSVCEALEQYLISLDAPNAGQLLDQAAFTLYLSLDRDPSKWGGNGDTEPAPTGEEVPDQAPGAEAGVPEAEGPGTEAEAENPGVPVASGPAEEGIKGGEELNDLAGFLVRMDPKNRRHAQALLEKVEEILELKTLPESVLDLVAEGRDALRKVTAPPRVSRASREEAVARVSELIEDALFQWEEAAEPVGEAEGGSGGAGEPEKVSAAEEVDDEDSAGSRICMEESVAEAEDAPTEEPGEEAEGRGFPSEEPLPETADRDLLADFLTEGLEYLENAEEALLSLEADPTDEEAVNVVFRAFHTIKGVSGFLELTRVSELAHHAETLLSQVRDGTLRYTGSVADLSLRSADVLKALLQSIRQAMDGGPIRVPPAYGSIFGVLTDPKLFDQLSTGSEQIRLEAPSPKVETGREAEETGRRAAVTTRSGGAEASVRVRTDRLDRLVDMVGELVIAHTMIAQDPVILRDGADLAKKVDHTAKILRELQDLSTGLRMVPLKPAFRKVSRVVRDLSRKSGKLVHFLTDGEETEIDRTMVDIVTDPLVHMVRNSIDHGLESPEEREEKGKARQGTIRVSAYQAGGNVVVEITDDGRGLDRDRILRKARERGIVESDRGMTENEIFNLIFAPGFSTAEKVTEISGRGVGMDVVRRNVESLRGRVTIDSEPGVGSTFRIHLPLTLAITDGMLIQVGPERFIIPTVKIHMSLRPEPAALSTVAGRGEMVLLHDNLLPVVRLHRLFGIRGAIESPTEGLLVIIGEGSRRTALLVDELVTQQQFVIKALSGIVANSTGVAGGAILGNGDVGLILDTEELISLARGEARSAA